MADKTESLEVAYDTQQEAYAAMFEELDAAIASLEDNLTLRPTPSVATTGSMRAISRSG